MPFQRHKGQAAPGFKEKRLILNNLEQGSAGFICGKRRNHSGQVLFNAGEFFLLCRKVSRQILQREVAQCGRHQFKVIFERARIGDGAGKPQLMGLGRRPVRGNHLAHQQAHAVGHAASFKIHGQHQIICGKLVQVAEHQFSHLLSTAAQGLQRFRLQHFFEAFTQPPHISQQ